MCMNEQKYRVIVADPAWAYSDHNTGGSFKSGSGQHYTTMKPITVSRMKVYDIAHEDSILFLWATVPLLDECFEVLKAWGFEYKTMITWYKVDNETHKGRLGLGRYFRGMTEHCLVGVRGEIKPFGCQMQNVIIEKPREHSRKPERFWTMLGCAFFGRDDISPRIELFCRGEPHPNYYGWGNQCTGQRKVELDLF